MSAYAATMRRLTEVSNALSAARSDVNDLHHEMLATQVIMQAAVEWFDQHRPQWGPGTLPVWYVDAKRMLDAANVQD